jgi:RNA polymerase sigma-70 factor (ECF subfamily)
MTTIPEELIPTRRSLLERLRNWDDQASWKEFFETYWRLIYGVARKAGLTDPEAQDVVQETIISVARQMPDFRYDPALGSFKAWLMRLTRWRITDHFRKKQYERDGRRFPREQAVDHAQLESLGQEHAAGLGGFDLEAAWNEEWEKQLFEGALAKVRQSTNPIHFQMFHLHVCKSMPARQVARRLSVKLAEVYFAKYKVSTAVRKEIQRMQDRML